MRQIKPAVLTFIINQVYSQEVMASQALTGSYLIKQQPEDSSANAGIIDGSLYKALRQLPELIFKFSTFKPVKNNMDKKMDQNLRDKITTIFGLVEQFKVLYGKGKGEEILDQTKQVTTKN